MNILSQSEHNLPTQDFDAKPDKDGFVPDRASTELIKALFEHIENQLARVDEKAELTITGNAILVAATSLSNSEAIATIMNSDCGILFRTTASIQLLMLVTLLASFYFSFQAVIPRLISTEKGKNLFDFSYIIQLSEDEYATQFFSQSHQETYLALRSEIHTLSKIANNKYKKLRYSFISLFSAFVLWAISQLLSFSCL